MVAFQFQIRYLDDLNMICMGGMLQVGLKCAIERTILFLFMYVDGFWNIHSPEVV